MTKPQVSVITPTYNQRDFIMQCISSVQNQTFPEWEQIIVDDGSTDDTEDLVQRIDDKRVLYIRQKHLGIHRLFETYNRALKESRAPLLAILEGDDFWPPNKLSVQLPVFKERQVALSYGNVIHVNEDTKIISRHRRLSLRYPINPSILYNSPPGMILKRLIFDNFIPAVSVIIRKQTIEEIGGFKQPPGTFAVDYATWLNLSLKGKFYYIPKDLGYSRRHSNSTTVKLSKNPLEAIASTKPFIDYAHEFLIEANSRGLLEKDFSSLIDKIEEHRMNYPDLIYFTFVRRLLVEGKWAEANLILRRLVHSNWRSVRLASMVALIASRLHTNVELPMQIFGAYPLEHR
jgi:glycosyltransferase involved in cell wall biosynthesis